MRIAMRHLLPPLAVAFVFVIGWKILSVATGGHSIASPEATLTRLVAIMGTIRFWLDVVETGIAFLYSLALSMIFGVALGIGLGVNPRTSDVIEPILVSFYSLPKVTLYPLVLLAFGLGMPAKVAFGVMHGLVPITLLTRNAIAQIKPVHLRTAKVLRLDAIETARSIVLPAILPELVAGVRIGFSLSLLGVIIGEMFASKRGLGFAAMNAMGLGDIPSIMAIGVFLAGFAVVSNVALLAIEKKIRN
jgi:NitT/TauT family transport system permease protein